MAQIIRRNQVLRPPAFSFDDLESHAAAIRAAAQQQANAILQQARAEAQRIGAQLRKAAHEQGLAEGRAQGIDQIRRESLAQAQREARQSQAQISAALSAGLQSFEASKRRLLAAAESGLVAVAVAIARRVCKSLVGLSPESACANARYVLDLVRHDQDLELHVNPAELEAIRTHLQAVLQQAEHVRLVADAAVEPGGCRLELRDGAIDAGIEAQLQHVADALLSRPESAEPVA